MHYEECAKQVWTFDDILLLNLSVLYDTVAINDFSSLASHGNESDILGKREDKLSCFA